MPVSIPWEYVEGLAEHFRVTTQMTTQEASTAALWIAQIATATAEDALSQAQAYTNTASGSVRGDLTTSLNFMSAYLSDDIAAVREYVAASMLPALDAIAETAGGVDDGVSENLINAYDAIAESHENVGGSIEDSILAAGEWIEETYDNVTTFVNDGMMAAIAVVGDTVIEITKGIDNYVQSALDYLIPAEMQALFMTASDILSGGAVRKLFQFGGDILGEKLREILTIDEAELQMWIKKGSEFIQDIAIEQLKPTGGV